MAEPDDPALAELGLASPLGRLTLVEREGAIVALRWGAPRRETPTPLLGAAKAQLESYFQSGLHRFDLPLAPAGEAFERQVWLAMREIPFGRTRSYGEIAAELGGTAQAVGTACGRNPIPIIIPCHRVLGAGGALVGYSGGRGIESKRALLVHEGVLLI